MKLSIAKPFHYDSGPNMTPLVDVVMVILIFLMLTGSFGAVSKFLPSTLPVADGPPGPGTRLTSTLDVYLTSPTPDSFQARFGGGETFNDVDSLRAALNAKRLAHEASGSSAQQMQVLISPRLNTRYHHVIEAYQAAMAAQWPKIGFRSAKK